MLFRVMHHQPLLLNSVHRQLHVSLALPCVSYAFIPIVGVLVISEHNLKDAVTALFVWLDGTVVGLCHL